MNPIEEPPSEANSEWRLDSNRNIAIAQRIQSLLLRFYKPYKTPPNMLGRVIEPEKKEEHEYAVEAERETKINTVYLRSTEGQARIIEIESILARGYNADLPKDFGLPSYRIRLKPGREPDGVYDNITYTTKYGPQPQTVMDYAGNFYIIDNNYFFNRYGQGAKDEAINRLNKEEQTGEEYMKESGLEGSKVKRIDFILSDEDYRTINPAQEDYELVEGLLGEISEGKFVPI